MIEAHDKINLEVSEQKNKIIKRKFEEKMAGIKKTKQ